MKKKNNGLKVINNLLNDDKIKSLEYDLKNIIVKIEKNLNVNPEDNENKKTTNK